LVVAGKKVEQCGWRKGGFGRFVAALGLQKRRKGIEEGMATAALRMAGSEVAAGERSGALWRTRGRTPGRGLRRQPEVE
jgi:hypothetical protein